jgi:prepilin-type N-terminal cleavage/methylation domain-containing protein
MKTHTNGHSQRGFTLVEIMIVVAIVAILATIGVPNYIRARKRTHATRILDEVKMLGQAIDQYALEHNRMGSAALSVADITHLRRYIKTGSALYETLPNDLLGNPFAMTTIDEPPKIDGATFSALSDVAPVDFWSPYYP